MSIITLSFIIFVCISIIIYFIVPKKLQWVVLLIANFIFYVFAGIRTIVFIIFTILTIYFAGLCLDYIARMKKNESELIYNGDVSKENKKKWNNKKKYICAVAIISNFTLLAILKYSNFIIDIINALIDNINFQYSFDNVSLLVPLGISFYTFQAVGYLIDVYRNKYPAEDNVFRLALFLSFFLHIIQGPFSRYDELGKTLFVSHKFSYERLCAGSKRILWGYFKKLIIADNIAIVVNEIFTNYESYTGPYMFVVAFFYGIQIYADFSGYMDIVCGISHILGINIEENFKQPYFAKSIDEFWRRWHITLGRWFRDYLFFPIAMSKKCQKLSKYIRKRFNNSFGKLVPNYIALFFVWTATGLWHGAAFTYLFWGYFNFIIISVSLQLTPIYRKVKKILKIKDGKVWKLFQIIRTFFIVCLFRFFSRGENVEASFRMMKEMFNIKSWINTYWFEHLGSFFPGLGISSILIFLFGTMALIIVDIFNETEKWEIVKRKCPYIIRCFVYIFLLFSIILFAGQSSDLIGGFIYENF